MIGYLRLCGLSVPEFIARAAKMRRYAKRVFIAPHWPAIFAQDAERRQTVVEAEATSREMATIYAELGYELVPLPLAPVAERVVFIYSQIV